MTSRLHLLPWNRPILPQAVEWLAGQWAGPEPLDLSDLLVVVPTSQSGRRLREALAAYAAARGQAVFPPLVVPPDTLVSLGASTQDVASRLASELAWIGLLRGLRLDEFRAVFPVDPPERNFAWARRLARQFMQVQSTLAEAGLRLADVAARAGPDFPEAGRWAQLARLELRLDEILAERQWRDLQVSKLAFASTPSPPPGIRRMILLAVPDPMPLSLHLLARYAETMPVTVAVCGPAAEPVEANFDDWGRPRTEVWTDRVLDWPDFEQGVRLCPDPAAQADQIAGLARKYAGPEGLLAVGVADPEILAPLETGLRRAGLAAFNPEGRPRRRDGLHALLTLLAGWARDDSFAAAAALLRCPDVLEWLGRVNGAEFSCARLLEEIDDLQAAHLPPTLTAARRHAAGFPTAARALAGLADLRQELTRGKFPGNALTALVNLFGERQVESGSVLAESAGAWQEVTAEVGRALAAFPGLAPHECWEFALGEFGERMRFDQKEAGALELNGWLELLWEDAPHLVVAGLNDGRVPEAIVGDAFLPESLRNRLGLATNAMRFARDVYLLATMAAVRAATGRTDLILGKVSAAGDPLRPSRLLLRCPEGELPKRVAFLFRDVPAAQASLAWTRGWTLRPRVVPPPPKLAVTGLRDYLACPFRFYLRHLLRMEPVDIGKAELDARDFGKLLHGSLQVLGESEVLRSCTDEAVLCDAMLRAFERAVRDRYGGELTLPLVVQFESARQRLRRAAAVQARESAAGWSIERVEWPISLAVGGLTIRGKIDRLDRHADGRWRVLDYKTSDAPVTPEKAHLGPVKLDGSTPDWAKVTVEGRDRVWLDLQLPLYRSAVTAELGVEAECGYFNLPKAVGESSVISWEALSSPLQTAAENCAAEIAGRVRAGVFWPPAERAPRADRDWAGLFHHGAAASIAAGWAVGGGS